MRVRLEVQDLDPIGARNRTEWQGTLTDKLHTPRKPWEPWPARGDKRATRIASDASNDIGACIDVNTIRGITDANDVGPGSVKPLDPQPFYPHHLLKEP